MRHPAAVSIRVAMAGMLAAGVMPLAAQAAGGAITFMGGVSAASYTRVLAPAAAGATVQFHGARVERSSATVSLATLDAPAYGLACPGRGLPRAASCHLPAGGGALALRAPATHQPAAPARAILTLAYD